MEAKTQWKKPDFDTETVIVALKKIDGGNAINNIENPTSAISSNESETFGLKSQFRRSFQLVHIPQRWCTIVLALLNKIT